MRYNLLVFQLITAWKWQWTGKRWKEGNKRFRRRDGRATWVGWWFGNVFILVSISSTSVEKFCVHLVIVISNINVNICFQSPSECLYSHEAEPPQVWELCKFYLFDRCAKKEKCLYLHKGFPCKYFHTGKRCLDTKESCKFSHENLNDMTRALLLKVWFISCLQLNSGSKNKIIFSILSRLQKKS